MLEAQLKEIVGADYVLTSPVDLSVYECDAETLDQAKPDIVVLPATTEQVAAIVKLANRKQIPFVPRGAGTGLSGGATSIMGGISIVLTRMTKIISIDPYDQLAVVQVGATNLSVSLAAQTHQLYFAPDPSSQAASTIGGNIAENAGGPHTLKYGMTTHHVLALKVVLPDGEITTFGSQARATVGLDLLGLFVGSEGTLGLVTEATLKLIPRPQVIETLIAYFPTMVTAGQAVADIIALGVVPSAMEMMDALTINAVEDALQMGLMRSAGSLLIVELDGTKAGISYQRGIVEQCLKSNQVISIHWAESASERAKIWKTRKSAFGALGRIAPHGYVLDGVIPRSKLAQAIETVEAIGRKYSLTIANVYHAGDGNLHPCLLFHRDNLDQVQRVIKAAEEILAVCVSLGGTLSGEHGIGIEKLSAMPSVFTKSDLAAMQMVHDSFNRDGLCNPGKVIPTPKSCGESGRRPLLRYQLAQC